MGNLLDNHSRFHNLKSANGIKVTENGGSFSEIVQRKAEVKRHIVSLKSELPLSVYQELLGTLYSTKHIPNKESVVDYVLTRLGLNKIDRGYYLEACNYPLDYKPSK
tara:strand:+ start:1088 stop:1408 length:321 start_codon:yes stop_codon:yes gene_type:complete